MPSFSIEKHHSKGPKKSVIHHTIKNCRCIGTTCLLVWNLVSIGWEVFWEELEISYRVIDLMGLRWIILKARFLMGSKWEVEHQQGKLKDKGTTTQVDQMNRWTGALVGEYLGSLHLIYLWDPDKRFMEQPNEREVLKGSRRDRWSGPLLRRVVYLCWFRL